MKYQTYMKNISIYVKVYLVFDRAGSLYYKNLIQEVEIQKPIQNIND